MANFTNLAQLARPQMQGNYPMGSSFSAGRDYAQQQNRFDGLLARAMEEAEFAAQENQQAAPVRQAENNLRLRKAQAGIESLPEDLDLARRERRGKVQKLDEESRARIEKALDKKANEWWAAQDDSEREEIRQELGRVIGKVGDRDFSQIPLSVLDRQMKRRREAQVNSTENVHKKEIKAIDVAGRNFNTETRANATVAAAQARGARGGGGSGAPTKMSTDQAQAMLILRNTKLTDEEKVQQIQALKMERATASQEAKTKAQKAMMDHLLGKHKVPEAAKPIDEARKLLQTYKGKPEYEQYKERFIETYGVEP